MAVNKQTACPEKQNGYQTAKHLLKTTRFRKRKIILIKM